MTFAESTHLGVRASLTRREALAPHQLSDAARDQFFHRCIEAVNGRKLLRFDQSRQCGDRDIEKFVVRQTQNKEGLNCGTQIVLAHGLFQDFHGLLCGLVRTREPASIPLLMILFGKSIENLIHRQRAIQRIVSHVRNGPKQVLQQSSNGDRIA